MFAALKSLLISPLTERGPSYNGDYVSTSRSMPVDDEPVDMESLFGDLPRLVGPSDVDDTDKIRAIIVKAFPELWYCPDQTSNRRKLYMAIYQLRSETKRGWIGDQLITKSLH